MSEDRLAFAYCHCFAQQLFSLPFLSRSFFTEKRKNGTTRRRLMPAATPTSAEEQPGDEERELEVKSKLFYSSLLEGFRMYIRKECSSSNETTSSTHEHSGVSGPSSFFCSLKQETGSEAYASRLRRCLLLAAHITQQEALTLHRGLRMMRFGKGTLCAPSTWTSRTSGTLGRGSHAREEHQKGMGSRPALARPAVREERGEGAQPSAIHGKTEAGWSPAFHSTFPTGDVQQDALWCVCVTLSYYFPSYWESLRECFGVLSMRHPVVRCTRLSEEDVSSFFSGATSLSNLTPPPFSSCTSSSAGSKKMDERGVVYIHLPFHDADWGRHQSHVVSSFTASASSVWLLPSPTKTARTGGGSRGVAEDPLAKDTTKKAVECRSVSTETGSPSQKARSGRVPPATDAAAVSSGEGATISSRSPAPSLSEVQALFRDGAIPVLLSAAVVFSVMTVQERQTWPSLCTPPPLPSASSHHRDLNTRERTGNLSRLHRLSTLPLQEEGDAAAHLQEVSRRAYQRQCIQANANAALSHALLTEEGDEAVERRVREGRKADETIPQGPPPSLDGVPSFSPFPLATPHVPGGTTRTTTVEKTQEGNTLPLGIASSSLVASPLSCRMWCSFSSSSFTRLLHADGEETETDARGGVSEDEGDGVALAAGILVTTSRIRQEKFCALLLYPAFFFPRPPTHPLACLSAVTDGMPTSTPLFQNEEDNWGTGVFAPTQDTERHAAVEEEEVTLSHASFLDPRRSVLSGWMPQESIWPPERRREGSGETEGAGATGEMAVGLAEKGILCSLPAGLLTGHYLYHRLMVAALWLQLYSSVLLPWWIECREGWERSGMEHTELSARDETTEGKGEKEEGTCSIVPQGNPKTTRTRLLCSPSCPMSSGMAASPSRSLLSAMEQRVEKTCSASLSADTLEMDGCSVLFQVGTMWEKVCTPLVLSSCVGVIHHAARFMDKFGCPVCDEMMKGEERGSEMLVPIPSSLSGLASVSASSRTPVPPPTGEDGHHHHSKFVSSFSRSSSWRWSALQQCQRQFEQALNTYVRAIDVPEAPLLPSPFRHFPPSLPEEENEEELGNHRKRTREEGEGKQVECSSPSPRRVAGFPCITTVSPSPPPKRRGGGGTGGDGTGTTASRKVSEAASLEASSLSSLRSLIARRLFLFGFFGEILNGCGIAVPTPMPGGSGNPTSTFQQRCVPTTSGTALPPMLPSLQRQLTDMTAWWEWLKTALRSRATGNALFSSPSSVPPPSSSVAATITTSPRWDRDPTVKKQSPVPSVVHKTRTNPPDTTRAKEKKPSAEKKGKHRTSRSVSSAASPLTPSPSQETSWRSADAEEAEGGSSERCWMWWRRVLVNLEERERRAIDVSHAFTVCLSRRLQGLLWCLVDSYAFYHANVVLLSLSKRETADVAFSSSSHSLTEPTGALGVEDDTPLTTVEDLLEFLPLLWVGLQNLPVTRLIEEILLDGLPLPCCALWMLGAAGGTPLRSLLSLPLKDAQPDGSPFCSPTTLREGSINPSSGDDLGESPRTTSGKNKPKATTSFYPKRGTNPVIPDWVASLPCATALADQQLALEHSLQSLCVWRVVSSSSKWDKPKTLSHALLASPLASHRGKHLRCVPCYPLLSQEDGWMECAGCYEVFHAECIVPAQRDLCHFTFPVISMSESRLSPVETNPKRKEGPYRKWDDEPSRQLQPGGDSSRSSEEERRVEEEERSWQRSTGHPSVSSSSRISTLPFPTPRFASLSRDEEREARGGVPQVSFSNEDHGGGLPPPLKHHHHGGNQHFTVTFFLCHSCRLREARAQETACGHHLTIPAATIASPKGEESAALAGIGNGFRRHPGGSGGSGRARWKPLASAHSLTLFTVEEEEGEGEEGRWGAL